MKRERVLIMGTGAMACWFAARLAPHADVVMAGRWQVGLDALRAEGVVLEDGDKQTSHRVEVADYSADLAPVRLALVLVKAYQTDAAAAALRRWLAADGVAVTLQNGLGNLESLMRALGEQRAALGVTTAGATLVQPAHVRAGGEGPTRVARHPRTPPVVALLSASGLDAALSDDALGLVWGKLVVSCAVNPITALLHVPNGALLKPEAKAARELACEAAGEAARVAQSAEIHLPYADPSLELERVLQRTAGNRSSMLQDVESGRMTEIDAITGAIIAEAERRRVPVPVNRVLLALIHALSFGRDRGES
ncbi:MAG: 2-dehydropantoate 2-reductase [Chloroflexi bacterium]|nr:2-dehydropantoate 2-reductase [Chloroflexota bacterium]